MLDRKNGPQIPVGIQIKSTGAEQDDQSFRPGFLLGCECRWQ